MSRPHNKTVYALSLLSAAAVLVAYLPSLSGDFLNWDDQLYVSENTVIRSIDLHFLKTIFTEPLVGNWHPLTMLSLALDYKFWGLDPFGYHLTNVILHSLNTALVFILCVSLISFSTSGLKDKKAAVLAASAIAALLFGLHPIHVESVAWISERKDVLSGFFFILSLLSYLEYVRSSAARPYHYAKALLFFTLAVMSKPMAVTLPVVLLAVDYYPLNRIYNRAKLAFFEKAPFFAISAFAGAMTLLAQKKTGALSSFEAIPFAYRVELAVRALVAYLNKMLLPLDLAVFYPMPKKEAFFGPGFFIPAFIIAAITVFCAAAAYRNRKVFLSVWACYVITLLPTLGLVQAGVQSMADRYSYLPSIGPFLLAGIGVCVFYERVKALRVALTIVAVILFALMAGKTIRQEGFWKDSLTLWNRQIEAYPEDALGYNNRGQFYQKMGDLGNAMKDFDAAVNLNPDNMDAMYNRGFMKQQSGNFEGAISDYGIVALKKPEFVNVFMNRGICLSMLGRHQEAVRDFEKASRLDPGNALAYYYLGSAYAQTGDKERSEANLRKAAQLGLKM